MTQTDFYTLLPALTLTVWASLLLLVDVFLPGERKGLTAFLAALGLVLTAGMTLSAQGASVGFGGMLTRDGFANALNLLFLLTGLLGIAVAYGYNHRLGIERGEYYPILLFSIVGMMLMAQATDLIILFLGLELLSIPLYVLAAFAYPKAASEEAGLKYFLLGAFASGFLVYGIALTFGSAGTTSLLGIQLALSAQTANLPLLLAGGALMLIGLGFKTALVPFHMWTPDVYQGAPTSVTAFMAAGAKAAGFAALVRIFSTTFVGFAPQLTPVLWWLAALTMIVGNVAAVAQRDIKRMLAYSSIAQAGYILMAFVAFGDAAARPEAIAAAVFYLLTYTLTSFGAWGLVISLEREDGGLQIEDYAGLGKTQPALAAAMTLFMLSFTGLPPTLGLVGKLYLFRAALQAGLVPLAVIGVITSLISAFYYLRVVLTMYMKDGAPSVSREFWLGAAIAVSAAGVFFFSLLPAPLFEWVSQATMLVLP